MDRAKKFGIADYLEQFDRSPYRYPAVPIPDRPPVDAVSDRKGSWFQGRPG